MPQLGALSFGNLGSELQNASIGEGVGGALQAAQTQQEQAVDHEAKMAAAARQRLTQIWQAGAMNPQVQNDPRTHTQIGQLWKQATGTDFPVQPGQPFDWNTLAPPRSINDLSPALLTQLRQMTPEKRQAAVRQMHILDADPSFLNETAEATPAQLTNLEKDYTRIVLNGGARGMSAAGYQSWVETNRHLLDQLYGAGAADNILNDKSVFDGIKNEAQTRMDEIMARIDKLKGVDPVSVAQIKRDAAQARNSDSLSDLNKIKTKYTQVQMDAYPKLMQMKIQKMQADIQQGAIRAQAAKERADKAATTGVDPNMRALLQEQSIARSDLATAGAQYYQAVNSGLGVSKEVQDNFDTAQQNYDYYSRAITQIQSPTVQALMRAAAGQRVSGQTTVPTTGAQPPNSNVGKTTTYNGQTVYVGADNKWHYSGVSGPLVPGQ